MPALRVSWWSTWPPMPERHVHALGLEPGELAAEGVDRCRVIVPWRAQELVVALVAAEHGVGEVEPDHRDLGEGRVALVLEPAGRHQVAGVGGLGALGRQDRALGGDVVDDRLARERLVVDVRAPVPRGALPEPLGGGVGLRLGRVERALRRLPRRESPPGRRPGSRPRDGPG